jgi:hypothetical protein
MDRDSLSAFDEGNSMTMKNRTSRSLAALFMASVAFGSVSAYAVSAATLPSKQLIDNESFKAGDVAGYNVDISGNLAIMGAHRNDRGSSRADDDRGAVFIFDVSAGQALIDLNGAERRLVNSAGNPGDLFGIDVALDADGVDPNDARAAVGAAGRAISGNLQAGEAYIFNASTGAKLHTLTARNNDGSSDADSLDRFGRAIDMNETYTIVGAFSNDTPSSETGMGVGQLKDSGAAYVYDTQTGAFLRKLVATDGTRTTQEDWDWFGWDVAISGNFAIVGAPGDNEGAEDRGAAYVFDLTDFSLVYKLQADDGATQDEFGRAVAISGDRAIVGAPEHDAGGNTDSGAAYIFDLTNGQQIAKLTSFGRNTLDLFGRSVAINDQIALVGAPGDNSSAANNSGAVYFFDLRDPQGLKGKFDVAGLSPRDQFGWSVALADTGRLNSAIIGAYGDDRVDMNAGAAYLIDVPAVPLPAPAWMLLGALGGLGVMRRVKSKKVAAAAQA